MDDVKLAIEIHKNTPDHAVSLQKMTYRIPLIVAPPSFWALEARYISNLHTQVFIFFI